MKTCISCKQSLSLDSFHKRTKAKDGLQAICKTCNKDQRKAYYKTAHGRDKNSSTGKRWRHHNRENIYKYLKSHPCEDCGETDPVVLEFDHLSNKEFGIAQAARTGYGWNRILVEIQKCEVVCSNCHRRRTAKRSGNWFKSLVEVEGIEPTNASL